MLRAGRGWWCLILFFDLDSSFFVLVLFTCSWWCALVVSFVLQHCCCCSVLLVFLLEFVCFHNLDIALCVWLACLLCVRVLFVLARCSCFRCSQLFWYLFNSTWFVLCSSACSFSKVRGCCCGALLFAHNLFCSLSLFLFMVVARVVWTCSVSFVLGCARWYCVCPLSFVLVFFVPLFFVFGFSTLVLLVVF